MPDWSMARGYRLRDRLNTLPAGDELSVSRGRIANQTRLTMASRFRWMVERDGFEPEISLAVLPTTQVSDAVEALVVGTHGLGKTVPDRVAAALLSERQEVLLLILDLLLSAPIGEQVLIPEEAAPLFRDNAAPL
jgi:hypothetical protein